MKEIKNFFWEESIYYIQEKNDILGVYSLGQSTKPISH